MNKKCGVRSVGAVNLCKMFRARAPGFVINKLGKPGAFCFRFGGFASIRRAVDGKEDTSCRKCIFPAFRFLRCSVNRDLPLESSLQRVS